MSQEKRVVVTGVSRGLGRAMVEGFAAAGARVWGCARSADAVEELGNQFGEPHAFAAVDVCDEAAVRRWSEEVLASGEPIDLLVNNAGVINANAPLWEVPAEEFDAVIDVNLKGVANVIRHFVPAMIGHGRGVIVNFSSTWGRSVSSEVAPYCATKWGIEGLTRALAAELPTGLAAVALNPGVIYTEMLESCLGSAASSYPGPDAWARRAVPFLLDLGPENNGDAATAP